MEDNIPRPHFSSVEGGASVVAMEGFGGCGWKVESVSGHLKGLSPKGCGTFMLGNFTEGYTTGIQGISQKLGTVSYT